MNIYFSPTERNNLKFPISNLSTNITNSITNIDELGETNFGIKDNTDKKDIEISEFYKKYTSKKKLFDKTKSQKKLNKIKVFFIVKSKIVHGKEVKYALPIRSYDDLGHGIQEKFHSIIATLFYVKLDEKIPMLGHNDGNPGKRPFHLDEIIATEPPFDFGTEPEFSLEDLILPKKYVVNGGKLEPAKDPNVINLQKVTIDDSDLENMRSFFDFPPEYEYIESMLDSTYFSHSSGYGTDIRQKNSLNDEQKEIGLLSRLREFNLKKYGLLNLFNMENFFSLIFGSRDILVDKNIIPVFSNIEDAQDLLITILDEIHQPFQVRRKVENYNTPPDSKSLSYLDDSFSSQNNYLFCGPKSKLESAKDLLMRYGIIKSSDLHESSDHQFYHENKYQTKGPFYIKNKESLGTVPKSLWRETDYLFFLDYYFPGQQEAYSWWESRDISISDKILLKKSQDLKIISMGLGDFLEFWNNPTKKNAEVLFIPSSNDLDNKKVTLPFFRKKSRDQFYDYQQKFRESKKQDAENYIYEIKLSAE